jgi:hypothetical protein
MTRRTVFLAAAFQQKKLSIRKLRDQFIGAWRLVSCERKSPAGEVMYPYGMDPVGRIVYDVAGRMSVHIMRRDRPKFGSDDRRKGTPEEIKAAFEGFIGYYGTYDVDEKDGIVVHHVEVCSFPNWVGTDQKRLFRFEGLQLVLLTGAAPTDTRLVWERTR